MKKSFDQRSNDNLPKFDHIHLICKDMEKAVEFYKTVFGAAEVERLVVLDAPTIRMDLNGTIINLRGMRPVDREIYTTFGLSHYGVEVEDLEKMSRDMKDQGIPFIVEPSEIRPGVKIAFFRGPSGELIELLEKKSS